MSEYIEIDAEMGEDGVIIFTTNLPLTAEGREETYGSAEAMEEGSPVAQALSLVPGIATLTLSGSHITLLAETDTDWHALVADVTAALKEFFL
jgi:hypothetical protein